MKRSLYIIGAVIIVILIGIWLFLLFADDSTKADVYNRFGLTGTPEEGVFEEVIDAIIPDVFQKQYLRQLTTRRVIGYTEVTTGSSTLVYFVEGGTGHIYTIDPMIEGSETRISNLTIPVATIAEVATDGKTVVVRSGNQPESGLTILNRTGETFASYEFTEAVRDFAVSATGTVLYTTVGGSGLFGKELDTSTKTTKTLFEVPFREATIVWGDTSQGTHYIFPKTSRYLEGYLYAAKAGKISRLPASGFGFMASGNTNTVLYSKLQKNVYTSVLLNVPSQSSQNLSLIFIPEKCTFGDEWLYCATNGTLDDQNFPDNWYRGETSFADDIWRVSLQTSEIGALSNTLKESGREIDAIKLESGVNDALLYFTNKNDYTLWVYESKVPTDPSE